MSSYTFPNINCNKPAACDKFIRENIDWTVNFNGVGVPPLTIYTTNPLTDVQLTDLTSVLNRYVDPEIWLSFNHTDTLAMHSHFTNDMDNVIINNKKILQTFIFNGKNTNNLVLDSLKTVVEYNCFNVQSYANTTSGSISLEIYDITRNISIASQTIELTDIAVGFHALAQSGMITGNTSYRSVSYDGLMNKNPNYDCIWQIRGTKSDDNFDFRCNSLQYIYYNVE